MKNRCLYATNPQFKDYGGRGIKICARWLEPKHGFANFLSDMGNRPEGHMLDRINNDGDYEPSNCKWSSRREQQLNRRVTVKVVIEGKEYIAIELARIAGVKKDTIVDRASKGLSYEEVMNPKRRINTEGLAFGGIFNGLRNREKTHCTNGHEFNEINTHIQKDGSRRCRKCSAEREWNRRHSVDSK